MERIPRQFFTNEFKEEAVKLIVDGGLSLAEAVQEKEILNKAIAYLAKGPQHGMR